MTPPDDKPEFPASGFDVGGDEELEAYVLGLAGRRPLPERLRHPATPEAYAAALAEAEADVAAGRVIPAEQVWAELEGVIRARG